MRSGLLNRAAVTVAVAAALAAGVAQGLGPAQAAARTVNMNPGLFFSPNPVTVTVGDTITWANISGFGHTTTNGVRGNPGAGNLWDEEVSGGSSSPRSRSTPWVHSTTSAFSISGWMVR